MFSNTKIILFCLLMWFNTQMLNQPYIPEVKPTKSQRIVSYTVKFPLRITYPVYLYPYSKVSLFYNFMFQCCLAYFLLYFPFLLHSSLFLEDHVLFLGNQVWQSVLEPEGKKKTAKMTVKKWNVKDRICAVTERKCSCKDTGEIFHYTSRVIIIH